MAHKRRLEGSAGTDSSTDRGEVDDAMSRGISYLGVMSGGSMRGSVCFSCGAPPAERGVAAVLGVAQAFPPLGRGVLLEPRGEGSHSWKATLHAGMANALAAARGTVWAPGRPARHSSFGRGEHSLRTGHFRFGLFVRSIFEIRKKRLQIPQL